MKAGFCVKYFFDFETYLSERANQLINCFFSLDQKQIEILKFSTSKDIFLFLTGKANYLMFQII